ncbi:reticulon-4-interacting protein 1 homolog, mitochondrial-like [Lineus longissimus]|uniref:reticulon-4-interacting protein 1 homolog, mitochondrial-like n=1 Tax=Lineus longissimus TaxID=88925 RepID=UPI002B4CB61E
MSRPVHCLKCLGQRAGPGKLRSTWTKCLSGSRSVGTMAKWEINEYGDNEVLRLSETSKIPVIRDPYEVLVEVHAASMNPVDVAMRGGYGSKVINIRRKQCGSFQRGSEFPLTLGRDFSGVVIETGKKVGNFKPGDEVWGALDLYRQGTHAEYAVTVATECALKPKSLDHVHAASMPYVGLTAWNAIQRNGGLTREIAESKNIRALVLGGSGGVGSIAVQLLKSWGVEVTATCSTDAVDMVKDLGADHVFDYRSQDMIVDLKGIRGFDLALDTTGDKHSRDIAIDVLKPWQNSVFVTTVTPLVRNFDSYGPVMGLASSGLDLSQNILQGFKTGVHVRWSFFTPNVRRLRELTKLVDEQKIKPVVEGVFPFQHIKDAYKKLELRHLRGKTVIDVKSNE